MVRFSGQRLKVPGQGLKRFGNCGHPAAGGLVGVDYLAVMQYFKYALMGFNQLGSHAECVSDCIRQTGGCF
jgi:hypothetical protein